MEAKGRSGSMLKRAIPGKDGNKYIPYDERHGEKSVVFFPNHGFS